MKKSIIAFVLALTTLTAIAVEYGTITLVDESVAGTTYIGTAQVTENTTSVSTNDAKWAIKRVVVTNGVTTINEAYSTNSTQKKYTNKWSQRATTNVTYKSIQ